MASSTTSAPSVQPLPAVSGNCRWIDGPPSAADLDAGRAILEITPTRGFSGRYMVTRITERGRVQGYQLVHLDTPDTVYAVDLSFGGWPHAECDCMDHLSRSRRRPDGRCKHTAALKAALARLGLE